MPRPASPTLRRALQKTRSRKFSSRLPPAPQKIAASDLEVGSGLQKVKLDPASKRGGLVTQGAVLKVTADGTSTSPVVRGVFINERILGNHIPPPPPGVPAIEPDIRGATSIRDQLDKHRNNESCASCHQTIDPPGFALENYDPVGVWRSGYGKGGRGAKVDPSGTTPEGAPSPISPPGNRFTRAAPTSSPAASPLTSSPIPLVLRRVSAIQQ
jgi:hypothetical protein